MHYYTHNPAQYLMATAHLDERRDLFYRRLRDTYVFREGRLPVVLGEVAKIVRARTEAGRKAVAAVLTEFFRWSDDAGWKLPELDAQIEAVARARGSAAGAPGVLSAAIAAATGARVVAPELVLDGGAVGGPSGDAYRQQRSRLARKSMFAVLRERGQTMPATTGGDALRAAVDALPDRAQVWPRVWAQVDRELAGYVAKRGAGVAAHVTADVTDVTANKEDKEIKEGDQRDVTLDVTGDAAAHTCDIENPGIGVATASLDRNVAGLEGGEGAAAATRRVLAATQAPLGGMLAAVPVVAAAGAYTAVVEAMRAAGLHTASAGDAELRRLVDDGAPVEAFAEAATVAVQRLKPLAWALARVRGKRDDAAATGSAPGSAAEPAMSSEQVGHALPPGVSVDQAGQQLARMQQLGRIRPGLTLGEVMGSPAARAVLLAVLRRAA